MNLARRQGWLIKPKKLTPERVEALTAQGADVVAVSFETIESYRPLVEGSQKQQLINIVCGLQRRLPEINGSPCSRNQRYAVISIHGDK